MADLFDMELRALRRDRAARLGRDLFLLERAFADCLERHRARRAAVRSALAYGLPRPRLAAPAARIPTPSMSPIRAPCSHAAGGDAGHRGPVGAAPRPYDLVLAIGTLDTVNDLAAWRCRPFASALKPDALPHRRDVRRRHPAPAAQRDARRGRGRRAARSPCPSADRGGGARAAASAAGFVDPVVDVDRVRRPYARSPSSSPTFARWARPTSSRTIAPTALAKAARPQRPKHFASAGHDGRTVGNLRNPPFRGLDTSGQKQMMTALTMSAEDLLTVARRKPAAWTWTRGGWRGRYPDDFAQAARRQARSDCNRIRLDRRAHRRRDDGRPFSSWAEASAACGASSATRPDTAEQGGEA